MKGHKPQELSEVALDLLLRLDSPSRERAVYGPKNEETSALHDYLQIVGIMDELRDIMSKLRRNSMLVCMDKAFSRTGNM